jgi:hypothetical protein
MVVWGRIVFFHNGIQNHPKGGLQWLCLGYAHIDNVSHRERNHHYGEIARLFLENHHDTFNPPTRILLRPQTLF